MKNLKSYLILSIALFSTSIMAESLQDRVVDNRRVIVVKGEKTAICEVSQNSENVVAAVKASLPSEEFARIHEIIVDSKCELESIRMGASGQIKTPDSGIYYNAVIYVIILEYT